jgi:hypothetical protein
LNCSQQEEMGRGETEELWTLALGLGLEVAKEIEINMNDLSLVKG